MYSFTNPAVATTRCLTVHLLSYGGLVTVAVCRYSKTEFLSNGRGSLSRQALRCHLGGLSRFENPSGTGPQQPRTFYQAEEVILVHEAIKVAGAVTAVGLVFKINPKPDATPTIQNIEGARAGFSCDGYAQQDC